MRFKDFKIVIDGTFDSDDEIEKLKSVFGNKVQSDEVETEKPETAAPSVEQEHAAATKIQAIHMDFVICFR